MIRTLSTLAILTALAGPAAAQDIRVSVAGKDDKTVSAEIHKAAVKVCEDAYAGDRVAEFYELDSCVSNAQADGMAQVKAIRRAEASDRTTLAALSPSGQ